MDDLDLDLGMVATEAMLCTDVEEAKARIRQHAIRVAQAAKQAQALQQRRTDNAFRQFMSEHSEDLLDDPEIMKRVQAREQVLMRAHPRMRDEERWHMAANDVRKRYGDANQRVIRGMRQQRLGARFTGDPESYSFDTGEDEIPDDGVLIEEDAEIAADRVQAIMQMAVGRLGRENRVDKAKYNEQELRRRQRGGS